MPIPPVWTDMPYLVHYLPWVDSGSGIAPFRCGFVTLNALNWHLFSQFKCIVEVEYPNLRQHILLQYGSTI